MGTLAVVQYVPDPSATRQTPGYMCAQTSGTMLLGWLAPEQGYTVAAVHTCMQAHLAPGLQPEGGMTLPAVQNGIAALARPVAPRATVLLEYPPHSEPAQIWLATLEVPFIAFVLVHHLLSGRRRIEGWRTRSLPEEAHAVVVLGQGPNGDDVSLHDPDPYHGGGAQQRYRLQAFLRAWEPYGYCAVTLNRGGVVQPVRK